MIIEEKWVVKENGIRGGKGYSQGDEKWHKGEIGR